MQVIPYTGEKVQAVRLYWKVADPDYGHTVACLGDTAGVRLVNLHTGDVVAQHQEHQVQYSDALISPLDCSVSLSD